HQLGLFGKRPTGSVQYQYSWSPTTLCTNIRIGQRQLQHKRTSLPWRTLHLNRPLVLLHDTLNNRQPQPTSAAIPRASTVRTIEPLEDMRQIPSSDPNTSIAHFYDGIVFICRQCQ